LNFSRISADWFDLELPTLLALQRIAEHHGWDDIVWQLAWSLDGYLWRRGHIHHQLNAWRAGLAAARRLSDNTVLALAHRLLGQTATRAGLLHEATHHLHQALRVTRDNGDRHGEARSHYDLALATSQQTSYALAGNNYTITGNTAYNAFLDTFQTHDVYDNNGCGNIFSKNKLTVTKAAGYGINVTSQGSCSANPNKVGASNTSTGGIGLTKIPLTPGL
jgi:hypothetical protein